MKNKGKGQIEKKENRGKERNGETKWTEIHKVGKKKSDKFLENLWNNLVKSVNWNKKTKTKQCRIMREKNPN